jgi:hypothetical protein
VEGGKMAETLVHHEELIAGLAGQLKQIMQKSDQGIYIYLDDTHKACNKKFAEMLGYKSPAEWANTDAPLADVVEKDQQPVIEAYENSQSKMAADCLDVRFKNVKTGKIMKARMVIVPIAFEGHLMSMHFFKEI